MKINRIRAALILVIVSLFFFMGSRLAAQAAPRELLYNHNFAVQSSGKTAPDGWGEYVYDKKSRLSGEVDSSDGFVLRCDRSSPYFGKVLGDFSGVAQSILPPPLPGTELVLTANVKCAGLPGGVNGEVFVEFIDSLGDSDQFTLRLEFDETSYTVKSTTNQVPADAQWCRVWLRKDGATGDMDVDYVSLTATVDDTPDSISIASSDGLFADKVVLSWNAVSNAAGYRIVRWENGTEIPAGNLSGNEFSFTDYDVDPKSTYDYDVYAVGSYGLSPAKRISDVQTTAFLVSPGNTAYHIDATGGNDSHAGTSLETAWKTFENINELKLAPGDQVLLKRGETWNEPLSLRGSGATNNIILVSGYGSGAKPAINPLGLPLDVSGISVSGKHIEAAAIHLNNGSNWKFQDLDISNLHPYHGGFSRYGLKVDNIGRAELAPMSNLEFDNLYFHDIIGAQHQALTIDAASVQAPIENVHISNCRFERIGTDAIDIDGVRHCVIENNTMENIGYVCLLTHDVYTGVFQNNEITSNAVYMTGKDNAILGIYTMYDWIIQNNYIHDCVHFSGQLFTAASAERCLIQHNYLRNIEGGMIVLQGLCLDNTIRYNIFDSVGTESAHNEIVRLQSGATVTNTHFYNNTVYVAAGNDGTPLWQCDTAAHGSKILNNVYYADGSTDGFDFSGESGLVVANNSYYGNVSPPAEDASPVTGDPLFTFPVSDSFNRASWSFSGSGYQLPSGSPCIDAGTAVSGNGGRDFFGSDATAGSVSDIGAAEYGAITSSTPRASIGPYIPQGGSVITNSMIPNADTYVNSGSKNRNYGAESRMNVRGGTSVQHSYLRFDLGSEVGNVLSAKLHIRHVTQNVFAECYAGAGSDWEEHILNWNNAPGTTGGVLDSKDLIPGEWVEYDVTGGISGSGSHTLVLTSTNTIAGRISTKEAGWMPYLEIVYEPTMVAAQGTPHTWLDQYGLVAGGDYDAAELLDSDGDGHQNWKEFAVGTTPTNDTSSFSITGTAMIASSQMALSWPAVHGKTYHVRSKTNLMQGGVFWNTIATGLSAADVDLVYTAAVGQATLFLRIDAE